MALSSTSKVQLSYLTEISFGTIPATPTGAKYLRMTGESLNYAISKAVSEEINSTRQTGDSVHVSATADGAINFEAIYREYDPLFSGLLANTFTVFGTDGVKNLSCDFNATNNTIACATSGAFTGLAAGTWVGIQGAGPNNGFYLIDTATDTLLTLNAATPLAATASGVTTDVSQSVISNGTAALTTFHLQKHFSDVGQYFLFRGMGVTSAELSMTTGSIMTGSFSFVGKDCVRSESNALGTIGAATAFGVMNAVTGVGRILVNGSVISGTYVKSASISINANLRGQDALGYLGNVGLGDGTFDIGGKMSIYLNDGSLYDTALADTFVSVQIPIKDVAGNGYVFVFDNVKLSVPNVAANSKDNDVMLEFDFTSHAPSLTTDKMIKIYRLGAAL